jgi:glycogen debranching enzyme
MWIQSLAEHLDAGCLGQISEIADADAPHAERGCVAQAWSVAELLRTLVEDVHQRQPELTVAAVAASE